jgi:hypothetical protein
VVAAQPARKIAVNPRTVKAIRLIFIVQKKRMRQPVRMGAPVFVLRALDGRLSGLSFLEKATASAGPPVFKMMKAYPFAVGIVVALIFAGCTTESTTTQTRTDQTTTRSHSQAELRKSGQSETGPALEQSDASVRMSGPH